MLQRENHGRAIIFAADGVGYARHMSEDETGIIDPGKSINFIDINQNLLGTFRPTRSTGASLEPVPTTGCSPLTAAPAR